MWGNEKEGGEEGRRKEEEEKGREGGRRRRERGGGGGRGEKRSTDYHITSTAAQWLCLPCYNHVTDIQPGEWSCDQDLLMYLAHRLTCGTSQYQR